MSHNQSLNHIHKNIENPSVNFSIIANSDLIDISNSDNDSSDILFSDNLGFFERLSHTWEGPNG